MKSNKNPYKLPEGYFDKLQSEVLTQTKLPGKSGFTLPEDYLDGLQGRVLEKVSTPKGNIVSIRSRSWFSIAASLVVVLSAGLWLWSGITEVAEDNTLANISETSVLEYLSADDLSIDQYAMMLDDIDIESIEIEEDIEDEYLDLLDETYLLELEDLL